MRKSLPVLLVRSLVSMALIAGAGATEPKWLEPGDEYVTPHIKWAKPHAQGPMRVLFITYRVGMREVVEICQRFDVESEVFAFERPRAFAGEVNPTQFEVFPGTSPADQERRLREKLALDYDCIVIGNLPWKAFPEWARKTIREKVAAGTGLTGYINDKYDAALGAIMANKADVDPDVIVGAFPFAGLPAFSSHKNRGEFATATLDLAQHGRGRVALLKGFESTTYQMVVPAITSSFADWHQVHYDYYLALAGRLMAWTSQRTSSIRVLGGNSASLSADRTELSRVSFVIESEQVGQFEVNFALRHGLSGKVLKTEERSVEVRAGTNTIIFPLPVLVAGAYFADLWVEQKGKTAAFGSRHLVVTSKSRVTDLVLVGDDFKKDDIVRSFSCEDAITGRFNVAGAREGQVAEVCQRDNHGRLVARRRIPIAGDEVQEGIEFTLRPSTPLSVLQDVEVRLIDGDAVLDARSQTFAYNDLFAWDDDVHVVLWQGYSGDTYLNPALHKVISDAGVTLFWLPYYSDYPGKKYLTDASLLRANMHEMATLFGPSASDAETIRMRSYHDPKPAPGGGFIRTPCVSDRAYLERSVDMRAEAIRNCQKFSTRHYTLGSELALTHGEREVCFGPHSVRAFRRYLKDEYGNIDRLNEEYGSKHTDWEQIKPVPYAHAVETDQIPLWIDFRRHMDREWAQQYALIKERATEFLPEIKIGSDASNDPGHSPRLGGLGGDDLWQLTQNMSLSGPYFWPLQLDCVRDFADPGTLIGGGWFGGYSGMFRGARHGPWHRWIIWYTLLRGANSFWLWQGSGGASGHTIGATIAPDFTWYDHMSEGLSEINRIQGGIGKLAMSLRRSDDGVAVLYSPASMLMANLTPEFPKRWDSMSALTVILPESNFQYRMIASEQVEGGVLREGDIRLLYLPNAQALSAAEVEEIRAFVKDGGAIVADLRPAVADEHGKAHALGALDDLFGVRQDTRNPAPRKGAVELFDAIGEIDGKLPMTHADASIKLSGGTALAKVNEIPAVIVNDVGAGKAVLFNFAISDYVVHKLMFGSRSLIRFTDEATAEKSAQFIRGVFKLCGIAPEVPMTPQIPGCHLYRFQSDGVHLMGLLQEAAPFMPGVGYNPMPVLEKIAQRRSDITLQLGEPQHVYDVLAGKYLGLIDQISRTVQPGEPHLFAALDYQIDSLSVTPSNATVGRGEVMTFDVQVQTSGAEAGSHVLRIHLTDPDGKPSKMYASKALAQRGKYTGRIPMSLDEKSGDWTISALEVVSGKSAHAIVKLVGDN